MPKYRTCRRDKLKSKSQNYTKEMCLLTETSQQQRKLTSILNIPDIKRVTVVELSVVLTAVFSKTTSPLEQKRFIM